MLSSNPSSFFRLLGWWSQDRDLRFENAGGRTSFLWFLLRFNSFISELKACSYDKYFSVGGRGGIVCCVGVEGVTCHEKVKMF